MVKMIINKGNTEIQCSGSLPQILTEMSIGVVAVLEKLETPIPTEILSNTLSDLIAHQLNDK